MIGAAALGALLGGLAGRFTSVTAGADGVPFAKAGLAAAALWILGTGGRLAFQVWATHGGGAAIEHFSAAHSITTVTAWTSALILMALGERPDYRADASPSDRSAPVANCAAVDRSRCRPCSRAMASSS